MEKVKWDIIGPEIKNDLFYTMIIDIVKGSNIKNILEIGASSGDGSTEAFILGKKGKDCKLFSIEVCTERFTVLKDRYKDDSNFFPLNISSVSLDKFPSKEEITMFMRLNPLSSLAPWPVETVMGWYDKDIEYVKKNNIFEDGIKMVKSVYGIKYFDCVLIDGSEFTGKPELNEIYGAKIIMLDDIKAYKNWTNHRRLLGDPNYQLLIECNFLRNGFSIFQKIVD
jgi:hypothetical protein